MSDTTQYQKVGEAWHRCGPTARTLDPGFYSVEDGGRYGYGLRPKTMITDELIDMPGTVADEIVPDIEEFLSSQGRFQRFGLTHKRGYLFYGPQGTGKTTLGVMLGRRFVERAKGLVIYAGDVSDFYHAVSIMRDVEPGRPSMYLIEEADRIVNNTHALQILDGELSIQGAIFVAMTNYKEKLPPRIANRPGRFDRVMLVDAPPISVQKEYLRRLAARSPDDPGLKRLSIDKIVDGLHGLTLSMAHLREAFISTVIMGDTIAKVRKRFQEMAKRGETLGEKKDEDDTSYDDPWEPDDEEKMH